MHEDDARRDLHQPPAASGVPPHPAAPADVHHSRFVVASAFADETGTVAVQPAPMPTPAPVAAPGPVLTGPAMIPASPSVPSVASSGRYSSGAPMMPVATMRSSDAARAWTLAAVFVWVAVACVTAGWIASAVQRPSDPAAAAESPPTNVALPAGAQAPAPSSDTRPAQTPPIDPDTMPRLDRERRAPEDDEDDDDDARERWEKALEDLERQRERQEEQREKRGKKRRKKFRFDD
jgi:hypothetical protein